MIEEVKEFEYLSYVLQRNGGQEAQVRNRVKKRAAIIGQVWDIGKKRFGNDWKKRVLFHSIPFYSIFNIIDHCIHANNLIKFYTTVI